MFKRFLSVVLAALIGAATPAVPAQAPSPAIERGLSVSAPVALPQLAQRLPDTIPPLYMLGGDDSSSSLVASFDSATDPFPSAVLSHSRGSLATMFDSTGKLTYAPNNLLTYSNTFSNAAWTTSTATITSGISDPLGGANAWTLTATGAGALLYQNVTVPTSANGLFAIYVKRRTGSGTISLRQPAGAYSAVTVTGSWTQVSTVSPGNGVVNLAIQIATSGDAIDIYAATLSAVTWETLPSQRSGDQVITTASVYYGPRIDYDPNTLAVKGLLIEEARTNLAIQSADVANAAWTKGNVTATANATTAPDGTTTAASVMEAATSSAHYVFNASAITVVGASQYTGSTFLKANGRPWVIVAIEMGGNSYGKYVDLSTGTIGSTYILAPDNFSIVNCGNGWYRVSMSKAAPSGGASGFITTYGTTADLGANSYLGDISKGYYRWGSQFELGSSASPYIPTGATSVAVAADVFQFTGPALTALQGSAGSAIVQMTDQSVGYSAAGGVVLGGSSTYWLDLASGNMYSNSGSHFLNTANAAIAGSPYRAGVAWNASGRSLAMNGGTVATDTFGGWAATTPYLGSLSGTANFANGHVASFAIYNQRLPDATLQAKSVVGASYAANDNGIRYAFADNDNLPVHWRVAL